MKKQLITGLAIAMALGITMNGASVFAAESSPKDVPVNYDNRNVIPDPEDPADTATWGVSVPTSITFTSTGETKAADVELTGMNGHEITELSDTFTVVVNAKSTNGMTLNLPTAGQDDVAYTLVYGATSLTGTAKTKIADLKKSNAIQTGTATLTGTANKLGNHKDMLTYTIENTVK